MQLSPLILKQHFITSFSIKTAIPNVASQDDLVKLMMGSHSNITTQVQTAKNDDNKRLWKVVITLMVRPSEGSTFCPYVIDAELLGFFEVHQSVDESAAEDLVACNGPAILFGAAREIILFITGRGPMPPFTLPSVTFIDGSKENRKKTKEAEGLSLGKKA
jgi:preprotein translocase subunit SecB